MNERELRFKALDRLYGEGFLQKLASSHVCIIGIGGIGSWAAEALARSAVGKITLVDLDEICVSNTNRQIHATNETVGKSKVQIMKERILSINPDCEIITKESFFTKENAESIISEAHDYIIDAFDNWELKSYLAALTKKRGLKLLICGGAGGKSDASQVTVGDISRSGNDTLLRLVRKDLRRSYDFPEHHTDYNIPCVYSPERMLYPTKEGAVCYKKDKSMQTKLDCENGLGNAGFVTGTFGLVAASYVIKELSLR